MIGSQSTNDTTDFLTDMDLCQEINSLNISKTNITKPNLSSGKLGNKTLSVDSSKLEENVALSGRIDESEYTI